MKILVAAFITALLVFTLATGWMEVVQPRLDLLAAASSPKAQDGKGKSAKKRIVRQQIEIEADEDLEESAGESIVKVKTPAIIKTRPEDAVLSEKSKARLATQLAAVKNQESKLVAREETLRMVYEDIRAELAAVEEIRRRSASELALAEQKVLDAVASRTTAASVLNDASTQPATTAKAKRTADSYIAGLVQDLANRGSIDAAALLLRGLKDREAAKVLGSLSARDERLATQLSDRVLSAKQVSLRQDSPIRR